MRVGVHAYLRNFLPTPLIALVDVLAMENEESVLEMTKAARTQFKLTHASPRNGHGLLEEESSATMDSRDIGPHGAL